jgi:Spy/CpxP family protein refolding chaperone
MERGGTIRSNVVQAPMGASSKGTIMLDKRFQRNHHSARVAVAAAAAALAMAFGGSVLAQPAGPHGGPHAMMGAGGGDEMLGHLIAHAQAQLKLNTSQSGMFDAAVAQTKAARDSGRALHQKVKDALAAELAKPEPDLAAVAAVADGVQQQGIALRHQVRDAWLQLYATFSPEQKAVVRDLMQQHMARMDSFRQRIKAKVSGVG